MPPVVGLFGTGWQRFSYVDQEYNLPPGTADRAALHLDRAAFGAGPAGPMAVLSFEEGFPAAALLPDGGTGPVELGPGAFAAARGPMLCIAGPALCRKFLAGGYPTLAEQDTIKGARAKNAGADAWLFVDMQRLLAAARPARADGSVEVFKALTDLIGIAHAGGLTARLDVDGPGLRGALELGDGDHGLLGLLPGGPLDIVSVVPKNPSAALLLEWTDAPAFFGGSMERVRRLGAEHGDPAADAAIEGFEQRAGVPFADFFETLGAGLAVYLPAPAGRDMLHAEQAVAVLPLRDPGAFRWDLVGIVTAATGIGPLPQTFGDKTGLRLPRTPLVVAFLNDRAVIGIDRAAVAGYMRWAASGEPAMDLKEPGACAVLYMDAGLLLRSYPQPTPGAQVILDLGRHEGSLEFGATIENTSLPTAPMYAAAIAFFAAGVMPGIERGKMAAKEAESRNNLHIIGMALAMFVNAAQRYRTISDNSSI